MLNSRLQKGWGRTGLALTAMAILSVAPAFADTETDQFEVTASVIAACSVTADDLDFGDYDPTLSTADDATSNIAVRCTSGTAFNIGIDKGAGSGATVSARKMTDGANTLTYTLYRENTHSQIWGNTAGVDTKDSTGTGAQQNFTVYGRIEPHETAPVGDYLDTLTVTVTFF